jgi:ABC-type spermidine/putrescine transport system permease subunit II
VETLFGVQLRMNIWTVICSHVAFCVSFVVVVVRASLKGFDVRLEEAAADLGADPTTTFWRITLPLIMPGVIGGALLAFTLSLDDFIISFFTIGPGTNLLPIEACHHPTDQCHLDVDALVVDDSRLFVAVCATSADVASFTSCAVCFRYTSIELHCERTAR